MIRKAFLVVVLLLIPGLTIFADNNYTAKVQGTITPKPDQAAIVFMRVPESAAQALWNMDSGQAVSIFDVSGDDSKFLGIVYVKTKFCYDVAPGEYMFMAISEAADFLKATVSAGKVYYVQLVPRSGMWKSRFSFRPFRQADLTGNKFAQWDSNTDLVEKTSAADEWAENCAANIKEKREKYLPVWISKSKEAQNIETLNAEDGR